MIDPTPHEREAMDHGGSMGGEYLDELGKTDLAKLTPEEWATFVECICTGYVEKLAEIAARLESEAKALRAKMRSHAAAG